MTTASAIFVGRLAELEILCGLISDVGNGRGAAIWVEGEPGIGKTALVDAALSTAGDGTRVFRAAGADLLQLFALRLIADAMQGTDGGARTDLADLSAGRRVGTVDPVSAALERILALIDHECARSSVVLVLDDIQWADEASLMACHRLLRVVDQIPLLLVVVGRRVPRRPEVDALRDAIAQRPSPPLVDLTGLPPDDVMAIAAASLSARVGPRLQEALATAAGNPLYVREMVEVLNSGGLVRTADGLADLTGPLDSGLSSLAEVIGRRLVFLSREARAILQGAAILSGRFGRDDLATVSGLAEGDLTEIVNEAVSAGILIEAGSQWTFRHPVIRQTLYDELPSAVRIGLHTHMAKSLAAGGAPWDRVARHVLAAGPGLDGSLLDWLAHVPPSALSSLPGVAADLLERGRAAAAPDDPRRALFTTRLTTALRLLHRQDALLALGATALRTIDDRQLLGEAAWNLAMALGLAGRLPDLQAVIARIVDEPQAVPPWSARLRALLVAVLGFAGRRDEAAYQAHAAIAEGERDGDPVAVGWALHFLALGATHNEEQLSLIDRALAVVVDDDPESVDLRLLLYGNRVLALSRMHRREEVEKTLPAIHVLAESAGSARIGQLKVASARHYFSYGQWDEALLYLEQVTDMTDDTLMLMVHGMAAEIAARRNDRPAAERHLSQVGHVAYHEGPLRLLGPPALKAEAVLAEADGRLDKALAIMRGWLSSQYTERTVWRPEVWQDLVRLALAIGDRDTAEAAAAAAQAETQGSSDSREMAEATICRAMIDDDPESLLAVAEVSKRVAQAFVLQEAAVRLGQRGDITAARSAFARAAAIYDDLGAVWDLRRLESRLRPFGIRRGPRSPHRRATRGWEALTTTERDVAHRVMMGESNPEIANRLLMSRRTVETHIRHILSKLDVRSRVDIAREGAQHERGHERGNPRSRADRTPE